MRLDKLLAMQGLGTRSQVKEMVRKGRVSLNGVVIRDSGANVTEADEVYVTGCTGADAVQTKQQGAVVDDETVTGNKAKTGTFKAAGTGAFSGPHWYMLNKPAGIVSANTDTRFGTVIELFEKEHVRNLFTVGRLDRDTEGLLLVTDDGELGHYLLSPKRNVKKTYYARVAGIMRTEYIKAFEEGFKFTDFTSKPAELVILSTDEAAQTCEIMVTVTEGKYHEIKRLVAAVGCEVTYLKRTAFAGLELDAGLETGEYRRLSPEEIRQLKAATGRSTDRPADSTADADSTDRPTDSTADADSTDRPADAD